MLTGASLTQMADGYLAGTDARTPLRLAGARPTWPASRPIRIDVGSDEVLLDDATALADRRSRPPAATPPSSCGPR